jgi:hypothetical protein
MQVRKLPAQTRKPSIANLRSPSLRPPVFLGKNGVAIGHRRGNQNPDGGLNHIAGGIRTYGGPEEPAVNQSIHQLLRLILEGFTWFLKTIEALWDWSWSQIVSAFSLS